MRVVLQTCLTLVSESGWHTFFSLCLTLDLFFHFSFQFKYPLDMIPLNIQVGGQINLFFFRDRLKLLMHRTTHSRPIVGLSCHLSIVTVRVYPHPIGPMPIVAVTFSRDSLLSTPPPPPPLHPAGWPGSSSSANGPLALFSVCLGSMGGSSANGLGENKAVVRIIQREQAVVRINHTWQQRLRYSPSL